ncbi:hypothetical protein F7Q99_38985 [Streptomyces kaniharaensis]|uniref:Uncharacterized protein n=1 Tax=Streptomyces kaniharaensis TaxID=212423 RepID=A0A6N7L5J6_9ACTN|nr:hypothetical protein [Streptomyces kaniharaensis]MQS18018.1 hypothetical protein [Streptomyces kaniharaensis]
MKRTVIPFVGEQLLLFSVDDVAAEDPPVKKPAPARRRALRCLPPQAVHELLAAAESDPGPAPDRP